MAANMINYFIESSIIFALLQAVYQLLFARYKNFLFNRCYLLIVPFFALLTPLLNVPLFFLPGNEVLFNWVHLPEILITGGEEAPATKDLSMSVVETLAIIYCSGIIFLLSRFIARISKVLKFIKRNSKSGIYRECYYLIPTHGKIATCSFFNYLLWDNSQHYSEKESELILAHEETHIRHGHSYDILLAEFLIILFWFNPAVYLYRSALTALHEFIADEKASLHTSKSHYISLLSFKTLGALEITLGNNFHKTQIFKRMNMLKSEKRRSRLSQIALTLPLIAGLFYLFACEKEKTDVEQSGKVYTQVDELPEPVGGLGSFYKNIMHNINYPPEAREQKTEGRVYVAFIVDENGAVTDAKVVKGIGSGCDEEALRVVQNSPAWKPGKQDGVAVKVKMILPIKFSLPEAGTKEAESLDTESKKMDEVVVVGQ